MASQAPFIKLDITLDESDIQASSQTIVKLLRPEWDIQDMKTKIFTEGFINKMFCCYLATDSEFRNGILVRIYGKGTEQIIDRDKEVMALQLAHLAGCSPPVFAVFNNGMVYGFAVGRTLQYQESLQSKFIQPISKMLARFHSLNFSETTLYDRSLQPRSFERSLQIFSDLRKMISAIPDEFEDQELNDRMKQEGLTKDHFRTETEKLERYFTSLDLPLAFCHNDIHIKNIIYDEKQNTMALIDFEVCFVNYEPYDFFCIFDSDLMKAWGAIKEDEPKMDTPTKKAYVRAYLEEKCKIQGKDITEVTEKKVERYHATIEKTNVLGTFYALVLALKLAGEGENISIGMVTKTNDSYMKNKDAMFTVPLPEK